MSESTVIKHTVQFDITIEMKDLEKVRKGLELPEGADVVAAAEARFDAGVAKFLQDVSREHTDVDSENGITVTTVGKFV